MNYLAIDTSSKNLIVILSVGKKDYIAYDSDCGVKHSETLMPTVERLLLEAGVSIGDIDFFACTVGAGSFTGIRIGVSTVKALAFATGKPALKVTSFDVIAYNRTSGKVLAVIDAGHGGYYVSGYSDGKVVIEPSYIDRERIFELSKEYTLLSAEKCDGIDCEIVDPVNGLKTAVRKNADKVTFDLDEISPLYVRLSQAEEGRK